MFPYIDIKYAAYKVIGTSLKSTSAEERQRFTDEFAVYMKNSLVDVLSKYTNQDIVPAKVETVDPSVSLVSVKLLIRESGKKDLELVLKLRKNNKTGQWKAFDLIGENISMLPSLWVKRESLFKENTVDLKDISSIDVSGMAILVKWAKAQKDQKLHLINVPVSAMNLINTYRLGQLFVLD